MTTTTKYGRARPRKGKYTGRTRLIRDVIGALVVLRRGRWTILELADELKMQWRSTYRLIAALRATGVTVERSQEGVAAYYQIPAEELRKLLRL
jgi:predicted DNA-binding transcriptional regulator YafY